MKAPHEVWVDGEDAYTTASTDERQRIRYLRADLTCGECAFLPDDKDDLLRYCDHGYERVGEYPACMAFAPKEEL